MSCSKKFAGEEHAVWKNLPNLLRTACELLDRVNAESDIGLRGKTTVVAINDEVAQRFFRLFAFLLHFIGATEAFGVDCARAHKDEIAKVSGELAPHPVNCTYAAPLRRPTGWSRPQILRLAADRNNAMNTLSVSLMYGSLFEAGFPTFTCGNRPQSSCASRLTRRSGCR